MVAVELEPGWPVSQADGFAEVSEQASGMPIRKLQGQ
jgi:hypothetical protein